MESHMKIIHLSEYYFVNNKNEKNMNAVKVATMTLERFNVISDIFSHAITGELLGMSNFASLAGTID